MGDSMSPALTQLLSQTQQLLALAQAGDWDAVAQLESERRPLLRSTFDPASTQTQSDPYQRALRQILDMDQTVMALAAQRRDDLRDQLQSVGQGRSAVRAYALNRS